MVKLHTGSIDDKLSVNNIKKEKDDEKSWINNSSSSSALFLYRSKKEKKLFLIDHQNMMRWDERECKFVTS